LWGCASLR